MTCSICPDEATCTVEVAIAVRPYKENRSFCEKHGTAMKTILGK